MIRLALLNGGSREKGCGVYIYLLVISRVSYFFIYIFLGGFGLVQDRVARWDLSFRENCTNSFTTIDGFLYFFVRGLSTLGGFDITFIIDCHGMTGTFAVVCDVVHSGDL